MPAGTPGLTSDEKISDRPSLHGWLHGKHRLLRFFLGGPPPAAPHPAIRA
jgi:hypothetical protein